MILDIATCHTQKSREIFRGFFVPNCFSTVSGLMDKK